jgi:hypothetical protein
MQVAAQQHVALRRSVPRETFDIMGIMHEPSDDEEEQLDEEGGELVEKEAACGCGVDTRGAAVGPGVRWVDGLIIAICREGGSLAVGLEVKGAVAAAPGGRWVGRDSGSLWLGLVGRGAAAA